ncbi:MAG: serine/threonine protein kinase, partial [Candidatus Altiarchaeales archaeon HGW-Altiarchaeales-1]
ELVTGKNPFDGDTQQQILMNILMKKPKKPSEINPAAKELDVLILKCLEKKKENRYQNVSELQNALEYKKSFTESKLRGDVKRSCFYCGELVKSSAKTRDMVETLKWINVFKDCAKGEDAKDIKNIINELVHRMENNLEITDELTGKIEVVVHHIQMQ